MKRERVKRERERERGEKEEKDEKDAPFFLFQSSTLFFSAFEPSPPLSVSLSLSLFGALLCAFTAPLNAALGRKSQAGGRDALWDAVLSSLRFARILYASVRSPDEWGGISQYTAVYAKAKE